MNRALSLFFPPVLLCLTFMIASAETSPTAASGIEGVILMSPAQPGPLRKDAPESAPVPNVSFALEKQAQSVGSITTDAEGCFKVSLPPGHYVISRKDPGARIGHWTFEADVVAGEVIRVRWIGDSGMR